METTGRVAPGDVSVHLQGIDGPRILETPVRQDRVGATLLGVLAGFTLVVVAGYASFGRHPALVASVPGAARWYGVAMALFPALQVWLAFLVMAGYLARTAGARWLPAFALLYGISLTSELLGTGYGIPFGAYHYTPLLGAEWMGRVPIVIPLSWFTMSLASYGIARRALGTSVGTSPGGRPAARILFASLLLLCWDLALDPAMSHATLYWVWGAHGPYYGMPWSNLAGWYVTGIVLVGVLVTIGADRWIARLSPRWLAGFYAANLALALGMDVAAGLWLAVFVTLGALVVAAALMRARVSRAPAPDIAPAAELG